jgi:2'-5' RNA ligase
VSSSDAAQMKPRESSIDILVPELSDLLRPWREASAAKGVPPHVSLLYPWRTPPVTADDIAVLRAAIARVRKFAIRFVAIERFTARALYLKIADESPVRALMRTIHAAFPDSPPYGGEFPDPAPHLTVAKASAEAKLDQLQQELSFTLGSHLPLSIEVRSVAVMEEDAEGFWRRTDELPLPSGRSGWASILTRAR